MRARILTGAATVASALAVSMVTGAGPAWAGDPGGQYGWTGASASGGQLTVQAGHTYWTPPSGSAWANSAGGSPRATAGQPDPNQPYGCRYQADPGGQATLGAGGSTPGEWVFPICSGPGDVDPMPPVWVANPQTVARTVAVDPVVVAQQAAKQLGFGSPSIEMAPPAGSAQLVGVATWLWINPAGWRTLTASATAGPVTATATAAPTKVVWDMGDGNTVTCDGPGTPYSPSAPNASTDCSYTWPQAGHYTVTATVYWSVTWTATGAAGGGNLGVEAGPPAQTAVTVTESQAINTPPGGSD